MIKTKKVKEGILVELKVRLGGDAFRQYVSACKRAGGHFESYLGGWILPSEKAVEVVKTALGLASARDLKLPDALYPFQREGASWLYRRGRGLLADEMGLGKTVQALCAIPEKASCVVVCPASVKHVWEHEAKRWRPSFRVEVAYGRSSAKKVGPGKILVMNYEILPSEASSADVLIIDEAHYVKNWHAKRTKRVRAWANKAGYVYLLTGTPLASKPLDLWGVLGTCGLSWEAFDDWETFLWCFRGRKDVFGYTFGYPREKEIKERLRRVMLRRKRKEVLRDLPAKTYKTIEVDIEGRNRFDKYAKKLKELGIDLEGANWYAKLTKDKAAFEVMATARRELAIAKIPSLLELVESYEDANEPLVVFSAHRKPVEVLGEREGWKAILGGTTNRGEIVEAFQDGKLRGIACTIGAGGVGITLTRACHVLFVDLAWTPGDNSQAEDRVCRIGQDRGVIVSRLVANHFVDKRITEVLSRKSMWISRSVG